MGKRTPINPNWVKVTCTNCGRQKYYTQSQVDYFHKPYLCRPCTAARIRAQVTKGKDDAVR